MRKYIILDVLILLFLMALCISCEPEARYGKKFVLPETQPLTAEDIYRMIMDNGFYCETVSGSPFHGEGLKGIKIPKSQIFSSRRVLTVVVDKQKLIGTKSLAKNKTKTGEHEIELYWQPKAIYCTYEQAEVIIKELNRDNKNKKRKWRIPTIVELFSIVKENSENHFPAVFKLPKNQTLIFWTSTPVKKENTVLEFDKKNKGFFIIRSLYNKNTGSYATNFGFQNIDEKSKANAFLLSVLSNKVYNYQPPVPAQPVEPDKIKGQGKTNALDKTPVPGKKQKNGNQPLPAKTLGSSKIATPYPDDKIPGFDDYKGPPTKKTKKQPGTQKKSNQQFPTNKIPGFDDFPDTPKPGKTTRQPATPQAGKTIKQTAITIPGSFKISLYPIFREGSPDSNKEKLLKNLREDIKKRVYLLGLKVKRNLKCQLIIDEKHLNIFKVRNITEILKVNSIISHRYLPQSTKLSKMKDEIMSFQHIDIIMTLHYINCGKNDVHIFVPTIVSGISNEIYSCHFVLAGSQLNALSHYIKDIIEKIIYNKFSR